MNTIREFLEKVQWFEDKIHLLEQNDVRLEEENAQLKQDNLQLKQEIIRLQEENRRLKEQLNLNSKNSSKPPSSDQKSSGNQEKRKGGAKPGHKGCFRALFSRKEVHRFITLRQKECPHCGKIVRQLNRSPTLHQQVEIPEVNYQITQYEMHHFYCPHCRIYGTAPLPKEVGSSSFGTRLTAFIGYLSGTCRLSKRIVLKILQEGLGIKAAVGSVSNMEERISLALEGPYQEIEKEVHESTDSKHIDETHWREWGEKRWLWVLSTKQAVYYKIQNYRNALMLDRLLGPTRWKRAIFITDRLALYQFKGKHQYCLAHIRRDLRRFAQRSSLDGDWGTVMGNYLDKVFLYHQEYRQEKRTQRSFRYRVRRLRDEFTYGLWIAYAKKCHSESLQRFAKSLLKRDKNIWVFSEVQGVEPTNNQAERDLRSAVIWRKICHGTKSSRGNRFVERIQSVVATLARNKRECLEYLVEALSAFKNGCQPPALLNRSC